MNKVTNARDYKIRQEKELKKKSEEESQFDKQLEVMSDILRIVFSSCVKKKQKTERIKGWFGL